MHTPEGLGQPANAVSCILTPDREPRDVTKEQLSELGCDGSRACPEDKVAQHHPAVSHDTAQTRELHLNAQITVPTA